MTVKLEQDNEMDDIPLNTETEKEAVRDHRDALHGCLVCSNG